MNAGAKYFGSAMLMFAIASVIKLHNVKSSDDLNIFRMRAKKE